MSRPPDDLLSTLLEYYAPEPARGAEAIRQAAAGNWLATLAELTLRDLAGYGRARPTRGTVRNLRPPSPSCFGKAGQLGAAMRPRGWPGA
jgi:hypothetical protein